MLPKHKTCSYPIHLTESSAVTNVSVNSMNNVTLTILWGPPVNPNGHIVSYFINIGNLSDGTIVRQEYANSFMHMESNLGELHTNL